MTSRFATLILLLAFTVACTKKDDAQSPTAPPPAPGQEKPTDPPKEGGEKPANPPAETVPAPVSEKHREKRVFTLENGVEVLLVRDPKAAKSGASVDVAVGGFATPAEHLGLAHYLEHLVFLGSEKYPAGSEFDKFVQMNGGWSNAYTADTSTNYQYEINTSAFEEGLDRFAQMFIAPTFNLELMPTELKNVDSEYQKNRDQGVWRQDYLKGLLADPQHAIRVAFQGDSESLKKMTQQDAFEFFRKYYVGQFMKLAIVSPIELDKQEAMVRASFAKVTKTDAKIPEYSAQLDLPRDLPRIVEYEIKEDVPVMNFVFRLPVELAIWDASPSYLITQLLTYEGEGSLASSLKKQGLITELGFTADQRQYVTELDLRLALTGEGLKRHRDVIRAVFAQFKQLQQQGVSQTQFADLSRLADLDYDYHTPPTGGEGASTYSAAMRKYGSAVDLPTKLYRLPKYDPAAIGKALALLNPNLVTITLGSNTVKGKTASDRYDFKYTVKPLAKDPFLKELVNIKPGTYVLPGKNPYIPESTLVGERDDGKPRKVLENSSGSLWMTQGSFQNPKATLVLRFPVKATPGNSRAEALKAIRGKVLTLRLAEWGAAAARAGYKVNLDDDPWKVQITISGYGEKIGALMRDYLELLPKVKVTPTEFKAVIEDLRNEASSASDALEAANRSVELFDVFRTPGKLDTLDFTAELGKIKIADFEDFMRSFEAAGPLTMVSYGSIPEDKAKTIFNDASTLLKARPAKLGEGQLYSTVDVPAGNAFAYWHKGNGQNNAWLTGVSFGERSVRAEALTKTAGALFANTFYDEMRTKRSLGYIAQGGESANKLTTWLRFRIQSDKTANELEAIALPWLRESVAQFANMTDADWETLKQSQIEELRQRPESAETESNDAIIGVLTFDGDVDRKAKVADEIQKLTKAEFGAELTKAFAPASQRRLSIYVTAKDAKVAPLPEDKTVSSANAFHKLVPNFVK